MRWTNLKTRSKLGFSFGILSTLSIIIGIIGYNGVLHTHEVNEKLDIFWDVQSHFIETRLHMRTYMHLQDTHYYNRALDNIEESIELLKESESSFSIAEKVAADSMKSGFEKYITLMAKNHDVILNQQKCIQRWNSIYADILNELRASNKEDIKNSLSLLRMNMLQYENNLEEESLNASINILLALESKEFFKTKPELIQKLENLKTELQNFYALTIKRKELENGQVAIGLKTLETNEKIIDTIGKVVDAQKDRAISGILVITIVVIFTGLLFTYIIAKYFTSNLNKIVALTDSISKGNLVFSISKNDLESKDEIGMLSRSIDLMGNKLKTIIHNIIEGANYVSRASDQLSVITQQISQGAGEQASSIEEVSSSIEEMVANIQQNADNAKKTELVAQQSVKNIEEISFSANKTMNSIQVITERTNIINDIAFQTNILALNAAVEAARAGENGRGFAVVASEVRKLAEKSKTAADEISQLSKSTVDVTVYSTKMINDTIPDIQSASKLFQEVTSASNEQLSGADQINNAIQQLNQIAQENAAISEEMTTTAEELSSQAVQLKEMVSYFQV